MIKYYVDNLPLCQHFNDRFLDVIHTFSFEMVKKNMTNNNEFGLIFASNIALLNLPLCWYIRYVFIEKIEIIYLSLSQYFKSITKSTI